MINYPSCNTIMAVSAGFALVLLVAMAAQGSVLALTGGVMTLTWPLEPPTQFDDIVFGEPCLALGVMRYVGGYALGSRRLWPDDVGGIGVLGSDASFFRSRFSAGASLLRT